MAWPRALVLAAAGSLLLCGGGGVAAQAGDGSDLHGEVAGINNDSLLWGPYRPNLYFGVRPRIPKSLAMGLLWGRVDSYVDVQNTVRYTCEQHEGMAGYGWDEYDARHGGVQTIHDAGNEIDITTTFVKVPGGAHGGSWAARIKGEPRAGAPEGLKTMVLLYVSQEESGADLEAVDDEDNEGDGDDDDDDEKAKGTAGDVTLRGRSAALGQFKLVVTKGAGAHPTSEHAYNEERDLERTVVQSLTVAEQHLWQAKAVVFQQIKETVDGVVSKYADSDAPPPWQVYQLGHRPGRGNVQLVQKMFEGPFEFDVLFSAADADSALASATGLTSADVTREAQRASQQFGARFGSVFALQAPYAAAADRYSGFARSMFSNLLGGIGYFYGHAIADRSHAAEYDEEDEGFWEEAAKARARHLEQLDGPYELFTSVPSRPFFPRGFLWDEGFHLVPIADWDLDLTLDVVLSWFRLMDDDGWIAREQILGPEARSKVPPEFQVQYAHYANPPTLFFIVDIFVERLRAANSSTNSSRSALLDRPDAGRAYLRELYPLLRRQFDWFRRTQAGDVRSYEREAFSAREAYRWRGRTEAHVLTSGLDDYPRPQPPHPGELHVDLLSWMGRMAWSLLRVAELLGQADASDASDATDGWQSEAEELRLIHTAIARNLDDLHWSEADGCYCDATIDDYEENKLVCHRGYISLFPLLVGGNLLAPDSPKVGRLLDLLGDPDELFSPHGLRSLSKKSPLYGTGENYWRGPVWININYLAIVQLHHLGTHDGPYQNRARVLYNQLRRNVVDTVYQSWVETGFAWEQYNPETGKGQRTQHFTGWTSLVVKIMTMPELPADSSTSRHDEL